MARAVGHEAVVKQADLHQVLAEGTRLNIVVVGLGDATKEVHRVGIAEIIVKSAEDESLGAEDFRLAEAIIGDMTEVGNMGREDFLVFGRDEHGSNADQLQTIQEDNLLGEESINDVDSQEEGLREQVETSMDLDQPVNENASCLPLKVVLVRHVLRIGHGATLEVVEILEDFVGIFGNHERVIKILVVKILHALRDLDQWLLFNSLGRRGNRVLVKLGVRLDLLFGLDGKNLLTDGLALLGSNILLDSGGGCGNLSLLNTDSTGTRPLRLDLLVDFFGGESSPGGAGLLLDACRLGCLGDETSLGSERFLALDDLDLPNIAHITESGTLPLTGLGCDIGG